MNNWKNMVAAVLLGLLGMGAFQLGLTLYKDLRFLHAARLLSEQPRPTTPAPRPQAAPQPQPTQ